MKEAAVWASKFKISEAKLKEWRAEAGPQEDLLRWCLLNGKINESDYLDWACRHFELPIVESHYFALEPDTELFERVKKEGAWKPNVIPLHEWENVLLIACVEPVPLSLTRPHRFVLAAASSLNFMWANLGHSLEVNASAPMPLAAPEAPAGLNLDLKFDTPTDANAPAGDMPDGFLMNSKGFSFGNESPASHGDTPPGDISPDGLNFDNLELPPASLSDVTQPGIAPELFAQAAQPESHFSDLKFEAEESVKPVAQSNEGASPFASLNLPKLEVPVEIPPAGMPAAPTYKPPTEAPPKVVSQAPAAAASYDGDPVPKGFADVTNINITSSRIEVPTRDGVSDYNDCQTFEEATDLAFAHMKSYFDKGIMLVFQSGQLRPWRWTGNVQQTTKGKPNPIDLTGPSIFRIPFKTGLPYHGYVTPNAVNTAFFAAFNSGLTPKHVTIMPLMVSGRITGMIFGITENSIDLRMSLKTMETIAENLSQAFATIRAGKAA